MQVNTRRIGLVHLMNALSGVTEDRLVALYADKPLVGREPMVTPSKIGQDVLVVSSDTATIREAVADEVIVSRVFQLGPAIFITGCADLENFFKKKEGSQIMGVILEAFRQVKGRDGKRSDRLHMVGPTEATYAFMNGRFIPFTGTTGIVITDVVGGRLYGINRAKTGTAMMSADAARFDFGYFAGGWEILVVPPTDQDRITWAGKVIVSEDGTTTMDVRFTGRRGHLLQVKDNTATWKPEHDANKAIALVDYGTPAIVVEDHDAEKGLINMRILPVKGLPTAFQAYVV